jgi:hypothetical protein
MLETEIRAGLLTAVATEPPLGFDPDDLIARARKESSRRRALVATGAATVLTIGAIVIAPMSADRTRDVQIAAAASSTVPPTSAPSKSAPRTDLPPRFAEGAAALEAGVVAKIQALLPTATYIRTAAQFVHRDASSEGFAQTMTFTLDGRRLGITVDVRVFADKPPSAEYIQPYRGPSVDDGGPLEQTQWVHEVRADHTLITVSWNRQAGTVGGPTDEAVTGYLRDVAREAAARF